MAKYRVKWEIEVDARTAKQAAEIACDIQKDVRALNVPFTVDTKGSCTETIYLEE